MGSLYPVIRRLSHEDAGGLLPGRAHQASGEWFTVVRRIEARVQTSRAGRIRGAPGEKPQCDSCRCNPHGCAQSIGREEGRADGHVVSLCDMCASSCDAEWVASKQAGVGSGRSAANLLVAAHHELSRHSELAQTQGILAVPGLTL